MAHLRDTCPAHTGLLTRVRKPEGQRRSRGPRASLFRVPLLLLPEHGLEDNERLSLEGDQSGRWRCTRLDQTLVEIAKDRV